MKKILLTIVFSIAAANTVGASDTAQIPESKIIESNFQNLNLQQFNFSAFGTPLVLATSQSRIFVSGRNTNKVHVLKFENENLIEEKILILPKLSIENELSRQYILDLKYDNNKLFVSFMSYNSNINFCDRLVVLEFSLRQESIISTRTVFLSTPCISQPESPVWTDAAGRIETDKTSLYISGGMILNDLYSNSYPHPRVKIFPVQPSTFLKAEKSTNIFGAIAKVNLKTLLSEKLAKGLRGPQGLLWDSSRKILWETEHGPRGGDELNIIKPKFNYGWPFVTLGRPYAKQNLQGDNYFKTIYGKHPGYTPPVFSWSPSIGVSQLALIPQNSNFDKNLQGNLLVSSLKDQSLYSLKLGLNPGDKTLRILYSERIYIGYRIRDVEIFHGKIVLSTDSGEIILLDGSSGDLEGAYPPVVLPNP